MMDADTTVKVSGGGIVAGLAYFFNSLRSDYKEFKNKVWARFDQLDDEMASHSLLDAQTFVTKDEISDIREEMNGNFQELRGLILRAIQHDPRP